MLEKHTHTHTEGCCAALLGSYSLQLNFKHSSQNISHRCHRAHGVYIPVCIRGVELRARCDRQRLTVQKDVFMFTVTHTHTNTHMQGPALQNRVLISPQEIYERSRHLYIIYKPPGSHTLTSHQTGSALLRPSQHHSNSVIRN